ncbi:MAG: MFS transporter [Gammaproteobacteria bacterium]|uniref:MFS transporter n=1 Tax=Pseudomaricurvus alcaniphilus TaxID=1166482 RepID=UPI00140991AF|nr:MFS transporter [Pseudomaricurvus alcaniphilus]MBR9912277.1 MFS transporter [Gammaproteobacteria bacterium]NHN37336.1 MFS transporter [Pseudomaricurvus alcaniphilus]
MNNNNSANAGADHFGHVRMLTYAMFFIFAVTTDAVGVIIPVIIEQFSLTLLQASTFHYAPMIAIAAAGIGLGFLADKLGRKIVILLGLGLFSLVCILFAVGSTFGVFLILLICMGISVGLFKTGALALIGDISTSTNQHTKTMNFAEGFFGVGAIIGPALVTYLLRNDVDWKYLYVIAGVVSVMTLWLASTVKYPKKIVTETHKVDWRSSMRLMKDGHALFFSAGIGLYVIIECAIYVWMPTLLLGYDGPATFLAAYALSIFFIFRAIGRFLAAWILNFISWQVTLVLFSGTIFAFYLISSVQGVEAAVWLLPISGLFGSVIYPTLNSKGISGFHADQQGAAAGLILFFTAASAALGPLIMGLIGDIFGHVSYGFMFATACTAVLFFGCVYNFIKDPTAHRLKLMDRDIAATIPAAE